MENEKSIVSQVTLDTSSINQTEIKEIKNTPTIHVAQSSHVYYKIKTNDKSRLKQLPFGTTSSRVTQQIEPKPSSQIISYQKVYCRSQTECDDGRRIVPFGSGDDRFKIKDSLSPGPCKYQTQSQLLLTKQRSAKVLFPSVGRSQPIKQEERVLGPGVYNVQDTLAKREQLRSKIREKFKTNKKKYLESILNRRSLIESKRPMNLISENQQTRINQSEQNHNIRQDKLLEKLCNSHQMNRFLLKQNTEKYLPKQQRSGLFSENSASTSSINNNFMSSFIEKRDYAYQSYIPKQQESPGPGYYLRKEPKPKLIQSSTFKSGTVRKVFATPIAQQKQKLKLSYLL